MTAKGGRGAYERGRVQNAVLNGGSDVDHVLKDDLLSLTLALLDGLLGLDGLEGQSMRNEEQA